MSTDEPGLLKLLIHVVNKVVACLGLPVGAAACGGPWKALPLRVDVPRSVFGVMSELGRFKISKDDFVTVIPRGLVPPPPTCPTVARILGLRALGGAGAGTRQTQSNKKVQLVLLLSLHLRERHFVRPHWVSQGLHQALFLRVSSQGGLLK